MHQCGNGFNLNFNCQIKVGMFVNAKGKLIVIRCPFLISSQFHDTNASISIYNQVISPCPIILYLSSNLISDQFVYKAFRYSIIYAEY